MPNVFVGLVQAVRISTTGIVIPRGAKATEHSLLAPSGAVAVTRSKAAVARNREQ